MMGDKTNNEIREACIKFARDTATGKAHEQVQPTGESSNNGGGFQFQMVRIMENECGKAIVTNAHHKYCNEEAKDGKCPEGRGVKYGERGCRCQNEGNTTESGGGFQF